MILPTCLNSASAISSGEPTSCLTLEQERMLCEIWKIHGLDDSSPLNVSTTQRTVGDITQTISGDGITTSTVTRT